jgi:hypothetical protein
MGVENWIGAAVTFAVPVIQHGPRAASLAGASVIEASFARARKWL